MGINFYSTIQPFFNDPIEMFNRLVTIYRTSLIDGTPPILFEVVTTLERRTLVYKFPGGEIYQLGIIPNELTNKHKKETQFTRQFFFMEPGPKINKKQYIGFAIYTRYGPYIAMAVSKNDDQIAVSFIDKRWTGLHIKKNSDFLFYDKKNIESICVTNVMKDPLAPIGSVIGVAMGAPTSDGTVAIKISGTSGFTATATKPIAAGDLITSEMIEDLKACAITPHELPTPEIPSPVLEKLRKTISIDPTHSIDQIRDKLRRAK